MSVSIQPFDAAGVRLRVQTAGFKLETQCSVDRGQIFQRTAVRSGQATGQMGPVEE